MQRILARTAGPTARRVAILYCVALVAATAAALPSISRVVGPVSAFLYAYGIVLGSTEALTCVLVLWRARATNSRRLATLAAAYAFSLPLILTNVAALPGVGALALRPQGAPWVWVAWHVGWLLVIAVFAARREGDARDWKRPAIVGLAAALAVVAVATSPLPLPLLLRADGTFAPLLDAAYAATVVVGVVASGLLARRFRALTELEVWIFAAAVAVTLDVVVTAVGAHRFSRGFYLGRIFALVSGVVVFVALVVEVARVVVRADRTDASERRLRAFLENVPQIVWAAGRDGTVDWLNDRWSVYTGQTRRRTPSATWLRAVHPRDRRLVARRWSASVARGTPFAFELRIAGRDGRYRWFLATGTPEIDGAGDVTRWIGTLADVDAERTARRQLDLFAELGDSLGRTIERRAALDALSRALVPKIADWTIVNLVDASGTLVLASATHRDPALARSLRPFVGTSYDLPEPRSVSARVFASGKPVLGTTVSPADVREGVVSEFAAVVERLGMHSFVAVPIVADGHVYGSFNAIASESETTFGEADVPFFAEVGRRMGYALQNAERYDREARIARTFQAAALPDALPTVAGLTFSHLYEPASRDANVGGDFYDAFQLADGRVVVSIGDVAGSGVTAAATMAALRQSIRAVARVDPDPQSLLRAGDAVFASSDGPQFASAFVAVIDPLTFSMRFANAGHPPAILRAPDGTMRLLGASDLVLGLEREGGVVREVGSALVAPGSILVLYTDGLSEAERDAIDGEARLLAAIDALGPHARRNGAATTIRDVILGPGASSHDDMALLAVSFEARLADAAATVSTWTFDCRDARAAHDAGIALETALRACGMEDDDVVGARLVFAELIGNVVRYAAPHVEVALDCTRATPVLHVLDTGPGFSANFKLPSDAFAERGRGLFIVARYTREFSVAPRVGRSGSHARAVLNARTVHGRRRVLAATKT